MKNNIKNNTKGISLITLVITIVIIIIISSIVIFTISNSDIIGNAKEAKFKKDMESFQDEIRVTIATAFIKDPSIINKTITEKNEIAKYSKQLAESEYIDKAYIKRGKLILRENTITEQEKEWAIAVGVNIDYLNIGSNSVTISPSTENWVKDSVTISFTYENIMEGYELQYKINSGNWIKGSSCQVNSNVTVSGRLYNAEMDEEIAINTYNVTNIDMTKPTAPTYAEVVKADASTWDPSNLSNSTLYFYPTDGKISGSTDDLSGIARYEISEDNVNWYEYTMNAYNPWGVSIYYADVSTTRYFRAVDNAGNASESLEVKVFVDMIAPTAPTIIKAVKSDWTIHNLDNYTNVSLYFPAKHNTTGEELVSGSIDEGSGIAKYQISSDNVNWYDLNNYNGMGVYFTDSYTTRYYRAIDNAGNASEATEVAIKIDTTAPTVPTTLKFVKSDWKPFSFSTNTVYKEPIFFPLTDLNGVLLILGVTEMQSGIERYEISSDGMNWYNMASYDGTGVYTLTSSGYRYFRAIDKAGNVGPSKKIYIHVNI